jgi:hypothetical protein
MIGGHGGRARAPIRSREEAMFLNDPNGIYRNLGLTADLTPTPIWGYTLPYGPNLFARLPHTIAGQPWSGVPATYPIWAPINAPIHQGMIPGLFPTVIPNVIPNVIPGTIGQNVTPFPAATMTPFGFQTFIGR